MPDVVTRFAPSPTGYLHVGGARTALFNRLYADRHGGRMLLRIEDTDRDRSTTAATDAILDGLSWLGIRWDGEPVFQSTRADRHRAAVDDLLASGLAYRCYATPAELLAMRDLATAEKRSPRYDGRWRDRDPSDAPADAPFAVRLKAPRDGETAIDDGVQGRVSWRNADLDDLVLLRQDGTPTYMLAVVVDDHDMGVTQIIRGDDHLTNAARQALIYRALGWDVPAMAHIPLIHSMQGRKLSKRDGAVAVGDYRDQGILPRAMRNHLLRLGWGHGDMEVISDAEASALFGLDGVGKAPSRFDPKRLLSLNGHYIRDSSDADLIAAMAGSRDDAGNPLLPPLDGTLLDRVLVALPALAKRANSAAEMADGAGFLVSPPDLGEAADPKVRDVLDAPGARDRLRDLRAVLDGVGDWTEPALTAATEAHLASAGLRMGDVAQPLRAALTGRLRSIGVFEILAALGRDESLSRLDAAAPAPSMEP